MDFVSKRHLIHASKSCVSHALSPMKSNDPSSISNHPILAIIIVAMLSTSFFLLCYYIFVFKCCFTWNHVDLLRVRDFSLSRQHEEISTTSNSNIASENRGLEESMIQSIPLIHYKKEEGNKDFCECVFCLNEFQEDEKLRVIPNCNHVFHIDCVDVWFQNNANCPLCRRQISLTREFQDEQLITPRSSPQDQTQNVENLIGGDENFVVIYLDNEHDGGQNLQEREVPTCSRFESSSKNAVELKLLRERFTTSCGSTRLDELVSAVAGTENPVYTFHRVISLGDKCVGNIRDKDDGFLVQDIRRSFSMDLSVHRDEQILHVNEVRSIEVCGDSSGGRAKRPFFSFGHGSRSRSAMLPVHLDLSI